MQPARALFIDDNLRNVKAAEAMGLTGIHFTSAADLQKEFLLRGLL
jgi:2-haloacid dehalogenase